MEQRGSIRSDYIQQDQQLGRKFDKGKLSIHQGLISYFPRALRAVTQVSDYGSEKYSWDDWGHLKDGITRYANAKGRHMLDEAIEGPYDPATNLLHSAQEIWNALARLELRLRSGEIEIKAYTSPARQIGGDPSSLIK